MDLSFYQGKKVLITGHTGFKGSWMCHVLLQAGALVYGYGLKPPTNPSLFELTSLEKKIISYEGDIRDYSKLIQVFHTVQPEIVFHLAAQPIVRESYKDPVYTYETNVMGTVYVCEAVKGTPSVRSFVNITTDKVYLNKEWQWGYRENEELNGFDPYSNSKSCSELVTASYKNSFFTKEFYEKEYGKDVLPPAVSTCRAGNVIGGGDFAADRIVPDCIRAALKGETIIVRNPYSTRPYQHVLEPIMVYLILAMEQYAKPEVAGSYNVGPDDRDCWTTGELVDLFCEKWNQRIETALVEGKKVQWENRYDGGPHEAQFLKLDCSKLKRQFSWRPVWSVTNAIDRIIDWTFAYVSEKDLNEKIREQIQDFLNQTESNKDEK